MAVDFDIQLLLESKPEEDLIGAQKAVVAPLAQFIEQWSDPALLPRTVGLFGGWGQGKTAALALLYDNLSKEADMSFIYFNAWKYAGRCDLIPTIVYRILQACAKVVSNVNAGELMLEALASFGRQFGQTFSEFSKKWTGIDAAEIVSATLNVKRDIEAVRNKQIRPMDEYFAQVDRVQEMLQKVTDRLLEKKPKHRIVVALDELDRCDPKEAFDTIKELRILFSLRGIPIVFILCTNPNPIGEAIRHLYGVGEQGGGFNPNRIMEKFVHDFVTTYEPRYLDRFIKTMLKDAEVVGNEPINYRGLSYVHRLENRISRKTRSEKWRQNTETNALVLKVDTGSAYYNNLRVLRKSMANAVALSRSKSESHLLWAYWHLNILQQVDVQLREHVRGVADQILEASVRSYVDLVNVLKSRGNADPDSGGFCDWPMIEFEAGGKRLERTPYGYYRMRMYEHFKSLVETFGGRTDWEGHRITQSLRFVLEDIERMELIVEMTMIDFDWRRVPNRIDKGYGLGGYGHLIPGFGRFGYLLFHH